tara:strand:- start:97 stop:381 length:285 start_codon:yes stop_codon:yes gene_type:complete
MARNVAHTSATRSVDGANQGKNDVMERGGSVSANPIWSPGGMQSPKERMAGGEYANQTGGYGEISPRMTPSNQHGTTGEVEHVAKQPDLGGHNV